MKREGRKSSFYVWFLGSLEVEELRSAEYLKPVVKILTKKERDVEPHKVTLQTSYKGLKIVDNSSGINCGFSDSTKNDKFEFNDSHLAVTCVYREDDIVASILVAYEPVIRWPAYIHVYRCDSPETAELLAGRLDAITEKKIVDLKALNKNNNLTVYDRLAAELRHKLSNSNPILLPPRDYDKEQRGMTSDGITTSSATSSGIGSDLAPSPNTDDEWCSGQPKEYSSNKKLWNCDKVASNSKQELINKISNSPNSDVMTNNSVLPKKTFYNLPKNKADKQISLDNSRDCNDRIRESIKKLKIPQNDADNDISARERFVDAKEKFLLLEKKEQQAIRYSIESCKQASNLQSDNCVVPHLKPQLFKKISHDTTQGKLNRHECSNSFHEADNLQNKGTDYISPSFWYYNSSYPHVTSAEPDVINYPKNNPHQLPNFNNINNRCELTKSNDEQLLHYKMYTRYSDAPSNNENSNEIMNHNHYKGSYDNIHSRIDNKTRRYVEHENDSIPLERYRSFPKLEYVSPAYEFNYLTKEDMKVKRDYNNFNRKEHYNYGGHMEFPQSKVCFTQESIEESKKRNSNELAKEFQRRSQYGKGKVDGALSKKFGYHHNIDYLDIDNEPKRINMDDVSPRYRHSYVENLSLNNHHHLTSNISQPRIGIAAVHPY